MLYLSLETTDKLCDLFTIPRFLHFLFTWQFQYVMDNRMVISFTAFSGLKLKKSKEVGSYKLYAEELSPQI